MCHYPYNEILTLTQHCYVYKWIQLFGMPFGKGYHIKNTLSLDQGFICPEFNLCIN